MKKLLTILLSAFILFSCGENQPKTESFAAAITFKAVYVAPAGSDNNAGTINAPVQSLNKAWSLVSNGDTVYLREGKFVYTNQQDLSGKDFIKIFKQVPHYFLVQQRVKMFQYGFPNKGRF